VNRLGETRRLRRMPPAKRLRLQPLLRRRDELETAIEIQRELDAQQLDQRLVRLGLAAPRRRRWPREYAPVELGVLRHSFAEPVYRR
jgi:hypothetical protein